MKSDLFLWKRFVLFMSFWGQKKKKIKQRGETTARGEILCLLYFFSLETQESYASHAGKQETGKLFDRRRKRGASPSM